jgi:Tol biopolymer transport system component
MASNPSPGISRDRTAISSRLTSHALESGRLTLTRGTRLGPYEILSGIGAGGMGEVYRATDTNLKRQVAIKVLPVSVAADADRLARFQREAEVLAALNHPNIAHIFGLEKADGTLALAMELVDGPTLADVIAQGAIPIDQTLAIARQIAEALDAAHGQGIIHRDLKPANIKVRQDGTVKVLDFGLAKALDQGSGIGDQGSGNLANSPTLTSPAMTMRGMILGTAAYMAPEQARGRAVDERADIWAFGCVLFEMLAGRTLFAGESVADTLAQVIERDPDWSSLPGATPAAIRRLLRRCLQKNPKRRLAAIADALLEVDDAVTSTPGQGTDAGASASSWLSGPIVLAVIGVLTLVAAVSTWGWVRAVRHASPASMTAAYVAATLGVSTPDLAALTDRFAVSPDGTLLAIVDGARGGLLLRRTSSLEMRPIVGTPPDAYAPVFSPDSQWIAFHTDRGLMKIPTAGGEPALLVAGIAPGSDYFINLTWGADDRIRYPTLYHDAMRSVSANGGPVETISFGPRAWVSRAVGLPNGRLLVSLMTDRESQIAVREADGTLRKLVAGWDARLAPTGYLLFSRQEGASWSIVSAPFDVTTATLTGDTAVLARDVPVRYATPAAASTPGDLFYVANPPRSDRRVVIKDRAGAEREVGLPPGTWLWSRVSPDGSRLAVSRWEGARRTIWTLIPETGALTQVTYFDDTFAPLWMPDGKRLVFSHFPIGTDARATSLWSVSTDGRGSVAPITAQWDAYPGGVSSDGGTLYYSAYQSDQAQEDIVSVALGGGAPKPVVLLATPASERLPTPSPDGRWLAYETNASGSTQTRVAPLADLTASVQVSTRGGSPIRWSRYGARFYYTDGDEIASVDIAQPGPVLTSRRAVFSMPSDWRGRVDVMPDGEHAVMIRGGLIFSDIVVLQGALPRRNRR